MSGLGHWRTQNVCQVGAPLRWIKGPKIAQCVFSQIAPLEGSFGVFWLISEYFFFFFFGLMFLVFSNIPDRASKV